MIKSEKTYENVRFRYLSLEELANSKIQEEHFNFVDTIIWYKDKYSFYIAYRPNGWKEEKRPFTFIWDDEIIVKNGKFVPIPDEYYKDIYNIILKETKGYLDERQYHIYLPHRYTQKEYSELIKRYAMYFPKIVPICSVDYTNILGATIIDSGLPLKKLLNY